MVDRIAVLTVDDYRLEESATPEPADGEVLCRTLIITIGAGTRAGLQGSASYAGAPKTGIVMNADGVARVEASRSPIFQVLWHSDHRLITRRIRPMPGLKSFKSARAPLVFWSNAPLGLVL